MKYLLILLLLAGCATQPAVKVETIYVKVPVSVPCKAEDPATPAFMFDTLKKEDDLYTKVKTILADLEFYKGYVVELTATIKACK